MGNINRKLSLKGCWRMVNAIQNAETPDGIRVRCQVAMEWLQKNDIITNDEYDELADAVAFLMRESYHM